MEQLLTMQELADYMQVTTRTVQNLIKYKGLPFLKIGRYYRFDRDAVIRWLEATK